jgi:hypothetical protein
VGVAEKTGAKALNVQLAPSRGLRSEGRAAFIKDRPLSLNKCDRHNCRGVGGEGLRDSAARLAAKARTGAELLAADRPPAIKAIDCVIE